MNRYLLLLFCILACLTTQAQYSYEPFANNGAVWMYHMGGFITDSTTGHSYEQYMIDGRDTTIRDVSYKQIIRRRKYFNQHKDSVFRVPSRGEGEDYYYGGLREQDKKIYFLYSGTMYELLLFDFNKEAGDTVQIGIGMAEISSIDTVFVANKLRRQFNLKEAFVWYTPSSYTEGFGGVAGLFTNMAHPTDTNMFAHFNCFSQGDELYSQEEGCMYLFSFDTPLGVANMAANEKIAVYPNPFMNELHIDATTGNRIMLYNITGTKVIDAIADGKALSTSALGDGVYLLIILNKEGQPVYRQQLIK